MLKDIILELMQVFPFLCINFEELFFMKILKDDLIKELKFSASRSSGSGGQHVNKVSTRIEAFFILYNSNLFSIEQKEFLQEKLKSKISKDGDIRVVCDSERSQYLNKQKAIVKMQTLLQNAFKVDKPRKASKPTKSSVNSRLKNKELLGDKKEMRKKINPED